VVVERDSRKRGRGNHGAAAALAAALSLGTAQAAGGKDIIFARVQDADSLDPARVSTTISLQVMTQMYDNLLTMDSEGKLHPGLASEWHESDDAKTLTLKIRRVKCHDGSMFDAAAAKWNIDRVIDPKTANFLANPLALMSRAPCTTRRSGRWAPGRGNSSRGTATISLSSSAIQTTRMTTRWSAIPDRPMRTG
jgi:ABC-type transport system substrate-binding protein